MCIHISTQKHVLLVDNRVVSQRQQSDFRSQVLEQYFLNHSLFIVFGRMNDTIVVAYISFSFDLVTKMILHVGRLGASVG